MTPLYDIKGRRLPAGEKGEARALSLVPCEGAEREEQDRLTEAWDRIISPDLPSDGQCSAWPRFEDVCETEKKMEEDVDRLVKTPGLGPKRTRWWNGATQRQHACSKYYSALALFPVLSRPHYDPRTSRILPAGTVPPPDLDPRLAVPLGQRALSIKGLLRWDCHYA